MKRRRHDKDTGRRAIDMLKFAYQGGTMFPNRYAIRDALIRAGFSPRDATGARAVEWSRQAIYELGDELVSVTNPVPELRYRRDPNATPRDRTTSRDGFNTHWLTRLNHAAVLARADAAQVDATPSEHRRAALLDALIALANQFTNDVAMSREQLRPEASQTVGVAADVAADE